ncbi:MAG: lipoyl synthase [Leptospiraceae bacterium]|nr:lipoyl synthase [Leptospiraceae bacterium]MDW8306994.1 lipoyl synthase [Leptospiraceae bacterium]
MGPSITVLPVKKIRWDFDKKVELLRYPHVHTVCEESRCPNRHECSSLGMATFLIGGKICTRSCRFCHIATGKPTKLDFIAAEEKQDILQYVKEKKLAFVVITSVARDDAELALAEHFADISNTLWEIGVESELLIPDFHVRADCLNIIGRSHCLVVAHNMETVRRLSKEVRPQADYERSLRVYNFFKENYPSKIIKGGFMVGLGETMEEIFELLRDMRSHGVEIVTVGQYLRPSIRERQVSRFYSSDEFRQIEHYIKELSFAGWEVGPFVRSSYLASRTIEKIRQQKELGQKT